MKILVIGSCTKTKIFKNQSRLKCEDIKLKEDLNFYLKKYPNFSCKASIMYRGMQHISILEAIRSLGKIAKIDYYIISAGFGLISKNQQIPNYDCSFNKMSEKEILERSKKLEILKDFKKLLLKKYDFVYLALGKKYLQSISSWKDVIKIPAIVFYPVKKENFFALKADTKIVSLFSKFGYKIHGTKGFKGDLLKIIAKNILRAKYPLEKLTQIFTNQHELLEFIRSDLLKADKSIFYLISQ